MNTLNLSYSEIETAVNNNMSAPGCQTYLRSDGEGFVTIDGTGQNYPSHVLPEGIELIPMPAMDPEGSGEENERFDEFSKNAPGIPFAGDQIMSYSDARNENDDIYDRDDYIAYAIAAGWESINEEWEEAEKEHRSFIIAEWVEGLKYRNVDSLGHEPLEGEYQVNWLEDEFTVLLETATYKSAHWPNRGQVGIRCTFNGGVTYQGVTVNLDGSGVIGTEDAKRSIVADCADIPIDEVDEYLDESSLDEYLTEQAKSDIETYSVATELAAE